MTSLLSAVFGGSQPDINVFGAAIVVGFLVGVFGHIIKSRTLILTGILLIGLTTAYFGFVVAKVR